MEKNNLRKKITTILLALVFLAGITAVHAEDLGGTTPGDPLPSDPENTGGNDTVAPQQPTPENRIGTGAPPSSPDSTPGSGGSPDNYVPPTFDPSAFDITPDTYIPPTYTPPTRLPGDEQPPETPTTQPAVCGNKICEHGETTACPSDCQTTPPTGQPSQGTEGITEMLDRTVPGGTIAVVGVIVVLIVIAGIFIYTKVNATE